MVARPGLPDKRDKKTLFILAGRPDSDSDRHVLSLTTCLALQQVRLGTEPNWILRGAMILPMLQGPPKPPASCADSGKRCHSIFKPGRRSASTYSVRARRGEAPDLHPGPVVTKAGLSVSKRHEAAMSRYPRGVRDSARRGHLPEWEGFS
jgi:hypothetical protein